MRREPTLKPSYSDLLERSAQRTDLLGAIGSGRGGAGGGGGLFMVIGGVVALGLLVPLVMSLAELLPF